MESPDLELVSTDDLLSELAARHDRMVCICERDRADAADGDFGVQISFGPDEAEPKALRRMLRSAHSLLWKAEGK